MCIQTGPAPGPYTRCREAIAMYWRSGMRSCEAATAIMPSPQRTAPMVNAKAQIQGKTERKGKEGEAHREELLQNHDEEDVNHGGSHPVIPLVRGLAVVHLLGRRPLRRRGGRLCARGRARRHLPPLRAPA